MNMPEYSRCLKQFFCKIYFYIRVDIWQCHGNGSMER